MRAVTSQDSVLARRNPVVVLGALTAVSLGLLLILDPVTPALLWLAAMPTIALIARIPLPTLLRAQLPFAAFGVGLLVVNAVSRPGQVVGRWGPLTVSAEGITVGASLALRVLVVGVLTLGFLAATEPARLMTSLRLQLHVSPRIAYAVLAGHRILQDLPAEWAVLRAAHRVRAPVDAAGRPRRRVRGWARCAFGLLVVAIRRGEQLSLALESRGLGLTPRTCWRPERVTVGDTVLVLVTAAGVAAAVGCSAAWGTLRGVGMLGG